MDGATNRQDLFARPFGAVYNNGSLYVVDKERSQVIKMTPTGTLQQLFGSTGTKPGQMSQPTGVAVDSGGNVYVSDGGWEPHPGVLPRGQVPARGQAGRPAAGARDLGQTDVRDDPGVGEDPLVAQPRSSSRAGGRSGKGREQFQHPNGIAFDPKTGIIYVSDGNNLRVKAMDQQGRIQWIFGEPPANMNDVSPSRRFGLAGGLALSQGYLFVADPLDGTVHVLD